MSDRDKVSVPLIPCPTSSYCMSRCVDLSPSWNLYLGYVKPTVSGRKIGDDSDGVVQRGLETIYDISRILPSLVGDRRSSKWDYLHFGQFVV